MKQKDKTIWRCNNEKEKWSHNGQRGIFLNNIIFGIHKFDIFLSFKIQFSTKLNKGTWMIITHYVCKMTFDHYY